MKLPQFPITSARVFSLPALAALAMAGMLPPAASASENLVPKGDFDAMVPTAEGASENVWTDSGPMASARIVADGERGGNYLEFNRTQKQGGAYYFLADRVKILPGQRYLLSFEVRPGTAIARVNLQFRDAAGQWTPQNDPASLPQDVSIDPPAASQRILNGGLIIVDVDPKLVADPMRFEKFHLTFTAPEGASSVRIALGMAMMPGQVAFDNVSLEEL